MDDYGFRFETNMLVVGLLEFVSCILINFFCHRIQRRLCLMVLMFLSALFSLLVQTTDQRFLELSLIGGSRLFNSMGFAVFNLLTSETFPTTIRSTGIGVADALSNLGNMSAPFLVVFVQFFMPGLKTAFVGGLMNLASGASLFFVDETKKEKQEPLR
jgi:predicted MFS family arabinose efflux permease